jgi:5-enolpyruvylshikimate-3-phosphate synthase
MGAYLRSLLKRRAFISEFARSELRNQNYGSVFGQLWLVLNPLLLSAVYFLLIYVIGGSSDSTRFAHLTASLFLFYLVANSLTGGVKAITSGQRLILNTSFPRIMLPVYAVVIAILKFLPKLVVPFVIHAVVGLSYSWQMLWAIPILMIAGLYLQGTLHVSGAEELRKKESDRLLAMQTELGKLGVTMDLFEDGFTLVGKPDFVATNPAAPLSTWHDHRIAMALTILNLVQNARNPELATVWSLEDPTIVNVSFPSFFETLAGLA